MTELWHPFPSAEAARFWCCAILAGRAEGARRDGGGTPRPCEPDDILNLVLRHHRAAGLTEHHLKVLGAFGNYGQPPSGHSQVALWEKRLWTECMTFLHPLLVQRQLVLDSSPSGKPANASPPPSKPPAAKPPSSRSTASA